jgi:hypothetical protein
VSSFYGTAGMADTCLFVSIYRAVSLAYQNGWGLTGCRWSDGFGFGRAISRNTFVGKESCTCVFFRERDGWMRVRDGIGIAISGCTYGLDVLG